MAATAFDSDSTLYKAVNLHQYHVWLAFRAFYVSVHHRFLFFSPTFAIIFFK
jgi:hypothetical protein